MGMALIGLLSVGCLYRYGICLVCRMKICVISCCFLYGSNSHCLKTAEFGKCAVSQLVSAILMLGIMLFYLFLGSSMFGCTIR